MTTNGTLKDKIAVVGGSSRGIGKACARALLAEGARVCVCGRHRKPLNQALTELSPLGDIAGVIADLSTPAGTDALIETAVSRFGDPQIVVVNTGGPPPASFSDLTDAQWRQAAELLLFNAIRLVRCTTSAMQQAGWGRIVFLTSISVRQPLANMVLSNTLRAAVTAFAKSLVTELACDGITVNCVCPGYTATQRIIDLSQKRARQTTRTAEQITSEWTNQIPAGRLGQPAEIAAAVAFLCSEAAGYINGVSLPVDGGWTRCLL
jgi:3-oxoacyl-[acyl-carrier protein] reductase